MNSLEKWIIWALLQKLPNHLGKIIVATSFEWLPKVQKNRQIWSHCQQAKCWKVLKRCENIGYVFLIRTICHLVPAKITGFTITLT